jgi:hypothetical protein
MSSRNSTKSQPASESAGITLSPLTLSSTKPKPDLAVLSEAFADIGLKLHPKHTPREPSGYYVRDVQDTAPDGREVAKCVNLQRGLGDTEGGEFMFDKNGKFLAYGLY